MHGQDSRFFDAWKSDKSECSPKHLIIDSESVITC